MLIPAAASMMQASQSARTAAPAMVGLG
jgi:hypothetical protein